MADDETIMNMEPWQIAALRWCFSAAPVSFVVAVGLGGGLTLALAPQSRNIRLAHWLFGIAWFWAWGGMLEVFCGMTMPMRFSLLFVFLCSGVLGVFCFLSVHWVESNHKDTKTALPTATPPDSPAPKDAPSTTLLPSASPPSAEAIATELAKIMPPLPQQTVRVRRARIRITRIVFTSLPTAPGQVASALVNFINKGDSEATHFYHVNGIGVFEPIPNSVEEEVALEKKLFLDVPKVSHQEVLQHPNQLPVDVERAAAVSSLPFGEHPFKDLSTGTGRLYIIGRIFYIDPGGLHMTSFCAYYILSSGQVAFCRTHNESDQPV